MALDLLIRILEAAQADDFCADTETPANANKRAPLNRLALVAVTMTAVAAAAVCVTSSV